MNALHALVAAAALSSLALLGCNSNEKPKEPAPAAAKAEPPLSVQDSIEADMTARVTALDQATRYITLQDPKGNTQTFQVSDKVRRLNEVAVGDDVKIHYAATLLAELRPPTAAESADPISTVDVGGRTPQGSTPAAGLARATRVVTTVEAVDVPNMRVTLRGPMGDLVVVRGRNADNLRRLKIGDTIVITYTRSAVVSLEKNR